MKKLLALSLALCGALSAASRADAQSYLPISRNGWEAFPGVEYQFGDDLLPKKKLTGVLVLTDSTLEFRECVVTTFCTESNGKLFKDEILLRMKFTDISVVSTESQVRNRSVTMGTTKHVRQPVLSVAYSVANVLHQPEFLMKPNMPDTLSAHMLARQNK